MRRWLALTVRAQPTLSYHAKQITDPLYRAAVVGRMKSSGRPSSWNGPRWNVPVVELAERTAWVKWKVQEVKHSDMKKPSAAGAHEALEAQSAAEMQREDTVTSSEAPVDTDDTALSPELSHPRDTEQQQPPPPPPPISKTAASTPEPTQARSEALLTAAIGSGLPFDPIATSPFWAMVSGKHGRAALRKAQQSGHYDRAALNKQFATRRRERRKQYVEELIVIDQQQHVDKIQFEKEEAVISQLESALAKGEERRARMAAQASVVNDFKPYACWASTRRSAKRWHLLRNLRSSDSTLPSTASHVPVVSACLAQMVALERVDNKIAAACEVARQRKTLRRRELREYAQEVLQRMPAAFATIQGADSETAIEVVHEMMRTQTSADRVAASKASNIKASSQPDPEPGPQPQVEPDPELDLRTVSAAAALAVAVDKVAKGLDPLLLAELGDWLSMIVLGVEKELARPGINQCDQKPFPLLLSPAVVWRDWQLPNECLSGHLRPPWALEHDITQHSQIATSAATVVDGNTRTFPLHRAVIDRGKNNSTSMRTATTGTLATELRVYCTCKPVNASCLRPETVRAKCSMTLAEHGIQASEGDILAVSKSIEQSGKLRNGWKKSMMDDGTVLYYDSANTDNITLGSPPIEEVEASVWEGYVQQRALVTFRGGSRRMHKRKIRLQSFAFQPVPDFHSKQYHFHKIFKRRKEKLWKQIGKNSATRFNIYEVDDVDIGSFPRECVETHEWAELSAETDIHAVATALVAALVDAAAHTSTRMDLDFLYQQDSKALALRLAADLAGPSRPPWALEDDTTPRPHDRLAVDMHESTSTGMDTRLSEGQPEAWDCIETNTVEDDVCTAAQLAVLESRAAHGPRKIAVAAAARRRKLARRFLSQRLGVKCQDDVATGPEHEPPAAFLQEKLPPEGDVDIEIMTIMHGIVRGVEQAAEQEAALVKIVAARFLSPLPDPQRLKRFFDQRWERWKSRQQTKTPSRHSRSCSGSLGTRFSFGSLSIAAEDSRYPPPEFLREQLPELTDEDQAFVATHHHAAMPYLLPNMGVRTELSSPRTTVSRPPKREPEPTYGLGTCTFDFGGGRSSWQPTQRWLP